MKTPKHRGLQTRLFPLIFLLRVGVKRISLRVHDAFWHERAGGITVFRSISAFLPVSDRFMLLLFSALQNLRFRRFCGTIPADSFARRHFVRLSRIVVGFVLFGVTFSAMFCLADSVQKPFSAIFPFSDAKKPAD